MKRLALFLCALLLTTTFVAARKAPRVKDKIDIVKMGKYDPVELGSGTMRLKKLITSNLEAKDFSVMLYPRQGTTGILYKRTPNKERLLLDKDGRDAVIKSYQAYLKDFEDKKLDRKKTKFEPAYEYARAKIEWGPVQYSSYADPRIVMGYIFVGKSPYFCINIPNTKSDQKRTDIEVKYGGILIYFTRSQAQDLVTALSEKEIQEALNSFIVELPDDDVYDDDDGDYAEADDATPVSQKDKKKSKKATSNSENESSQEDIAEAEDLGDYAEE